MPQIDPLLDLIWPRDCPGCGGPSGGGGAGLCRSCASQLGGQWVPAGGVVGIDRCWTMGSYGGPLGGLVRRAKLRPDLLLADVLGRWMAAGAPAGMEVDAVVPVPSTWWRALRRGQDLPLRLAGPVSRAIDVPMRRCLVHTGAGRQAGKGRAARQATAGRFWPRGEVPPRVLLVDDVRTTGSTAAACADGLRRGGAVWVGLCTVVVQARRSVKRS